MQTDVNSLDVNVDVHPQLELLPVLDHKDLQGGLLLTNHLDFENMEIYQLTLHLQSCAQTFSYILGLFPKHFHIVSRAGCAGGDASY